MDIDECNVPAADWERAMNKMAIEGFLMNKMAIEGFLLFVVGILSFGLVPMFLVWRKARRHK